MIESEPAEQLEGHVFRSIGDFRVLDHADLGFSVADYSPSQKRLLWANKSLMKSFNVTLKEWTSLNLDNVSKPVKEFQEEVYQTVQVRGATLEKLKTLYLKGVPKTFIFVFKPIQVHLAEMPQQKTMMLVAYKDVFSASNADEHSVSKWIFAEELLRYTDVMTAMYDLETEDLCYESRKCNSFYEDVFAGKEGGRKKQLSDVFESGAWSNEEQARLQADVKALSLTSQKIDIECRKIRPGQQECEERWHQVHFIPCVNPNNGRVSVIVNEYDVTTQKLQAEQLTASRVQQKFLAAVSHELKTPLHGIIGLADSLLPECGPSSPPQLEKSLLLIKNCGSRLTMLVNNILDAASFKNGTFTVNFGDVNLCEVADQVCSVLSSLVPKGVSLSNRIDPQLRTVCADGQRVHQIFTNLVSNAIKFTSKGKITVAARVVEEEGEVEIEVADRGIGIPQSQLGKVFEPFTQVDMDSNRQYEGTGLGLSLVKQMVESHHGRVHILSQQQGPSRGTRVLVRLPLSQRTASASSSESGPFARFPSSHPIRQVQLHKPVSSLGHPPSPTGLPPPRSTTTSKLSEGLHPRPLAEQDGPKFKVESQHVTTSPAAWTVDEQPGGAGSSARGAGGVSRSSSEVAAIEILSVDDSWANQVVVQNTFTPLGYKVTVCMSAREVLDLVKTRGRLPDVMLVDVMMPGMSGLQLCEELRAVYALTTLPIIIVSAKSQEEDIISGLNAGCNDYITKPFKAAEALARIQVQLHIKEALQNAKHALQCCELCQGKDYASSEHSSATSHIPPIPRPISDRPEDASGLLGIRVAEIDRRAAAGDPLLHMLHGLSPVAPHQKRQAAGAQKEWSLAHKARRSVQRIPGGG